MPKKLYGSVKSNRLALRNADLSEFNNKEVVVTIEEKKPFMSNDQRAFYWSGFLDSEVECFEEFYGMQFSKKQIHQWNHEHFFRVEVHNSTTDEIESFPIESTTRYTTREWEKKLDEIRAKFEEAFNWKLPYPERDEALR